MRVLLISPVPTHPTNAGNCIRILNLMKALETLGHEPHFLHTTFQRGDHHAMRAAFNDRFHEHEYRKPWRRYRLCGIPLPHRVAHHMDYRGWLTQRIDHFYDPTLNESVKQLHAHYQFEAVMVEYVFFSKALDALPTNVRKLIDTHDVYTDRHKLLRKNGMTVDWFFTSRIEECKGLRRADTVIAIQDTEQKTLSDIVNAERQVVTVGHFVKPQAAPLPQRLKKILMVGSNNPLNVCYFQQFIDDCWKPFSKKHPDCELMIGGGVGSEIEPIDQVRILGYVENLSAVYAQSDLVVNPLLTGTGLKIKSLEALAYGRALLSTPAGLEGLSNAIGHGAMQADDFDAMQAALEEFYHNHAKLREYCSAAGSFALQYEREQYHALQQAIAG